MSNIRQTVQKNICPKCGKVHDGKEKECGECGCYKCEHYYPDMSGGGCLSDDKHSCLIPPMENCGRFKNKEESK